MRNLVIFSLLISFSGISSLSYAQKNKNDSLFKEVSMPVDDVSKLITYKKVVSVNDIKKDSLYKKGLSWFFSYYKNPRGVIKSQNPADGKIIGRPQFKILNPPDKNGTESMNGIIYYTITTSYKDGKCKIEIADINLEQASKFPIEKWLDKSQKTYTTAYNYFLKQINDYMKKTVKSFEDAMTAVPISKNDGW